MIQRNSSAASASRSQDAVEVASTKLPLKVGEDGIGDIFDADNRIVAATDSWAIGTNRTPKINREFAGLIVKAVNNHAALIDALEKIAGKGDGFDYLKDAMNCARAALAAVEANSLTPDR